MKTMIMIEIDASKTMVETMQRTGFELVPDGTCFQIKIPNSPNIPRRKTKVVFHNNPSHNTNDVKAFLNSEKVISSEPAVLATPLESK